MKYFKQLMLAVTLLISASAASAQATGTCSTLGLVTTCNYAISDDSYAIVPIPFGFPYYGRVFTHSIFFDNGLVSFYDPQTEGMRLGGQQFFAQPLSDNIGSNFHYSIMPLWSDLRNYSGSYFTETDGQGFLRYNWENISQFGHPDRLNTFSLEIQPSGYIGINYQQINIDGYPVTAGLVGNAGLGEWQQHFYASSSQPVSTGSISNWSVTETFATDCSNPLNNVNCPGYSEAFFTQQCSVSALYDPACPGYDVAYYDQQCGLDPLYHTGCSGHDEAYLDQQCGLNTLYDTRCEGYDDAYFDQQCELDPLYDEACPLYADAFYVQQCTADPLYDSGCTGYAEAFAKKYILTEPAAATVTTAEPEPVVEVAVAETAAATADPADTTSPVQLVSESAATTTIAVATEAPKTETAAAPAPRTTRQALAERRMAAARAQAAQRARENPDAMAEQMDSAESMEQQVEVQNVVLGAMSFVPGFDAYGRATLPDAAGYAPFEIYSGQQNIDTPAARRLLGGSDRLHQEMVNEQYR